MDTAIWKIAEALIVVLFPVNNMKKTITILITILICASTVLAVDWAINNTEWKKVDSNTFQEVELQPKVLQTVKNKAKISTIFDIFTKKVIPAFV